jgi:endonuclease/exonuclease/phosphatase (EEP) superfamily protein YafD
MTLLTRILRAATGFGAVGTALAALLALGGFTVPALDLLNHFQILWFGGALLALALVLAVFRGSPWRWRLAAVAAAGLVASAISFVPEALSGLRPHAPLPGDGRPVLKLMSHNLFGLNYDMARVDAVILAEDPDIIVLQEYFAEQSSDLHPLIRLRYPYFAHCQGGKRANLGLYSRLPFSQTGSDEGCPDHAYGPQRTARIKAHFTLEGGGSFALVTTHLDWPLPLARQAEQFAELAGAVALQEEPVVVAADFNSTPWSFAMRGFEAATGLERHTRNLVTFPLRFTFRGLPGLVDAIPFLPIDHVLTSSGVTVHDVYAGPYTGSDHLPVFATFTVGGGGGGG